MRRDANRALSPAVVQVLSPSGRPGHFGSRPESPVAGLSRLHLPLVGATIAIVSFGVLMVFSAGRGPTGDLGFGTRQATFGAIGALAMVVVSLVDYRKLQRWYPILILAALTALVLVLTPLGTEVRGTQGWFRLGGLAVQPSEFAKLALIVGLAVILNGGPEVRRSSRALLVGRPTIDEPSDYDVDTGSSSRLAASIALLGVMSALVLAEGESGTVLVYCAIALGMMLTAGVQARYLVLLTVSGVAVIGLALSSGLLAAYQVDRFEAFLDADLDPQGIGYNQQQALTAIGSGGLRGAGLFDGPQTQLGYLPDQHTDFIFAAVAEELGFAGALLLLLLEVAVLVSIFVIGLESRDRFAQLLCAGVFSLLAFQVFQNVAMNLRMMPITGISLPFVSYGGSSLLTSLLAVGLVQSVAVNRGG